MVIQDDYQELLSYLPAHLIVAMARTLTAPGRLAPNFDEIIARLVNNDKADGTCTGCGKKGDRGGGGQWW